MGSGREERGIGSFGRAALRRESDLDKCAGRVVVLRRLRSEGRVVSRRRSLLSTSSRLDHLNAPTHCIYNHTNIFLQLG